MSSLAAHADLAAQSTDSHAKSALGTKTTLDTRIGDANARGESLRTEESAPLTEDWRPVVGRNGYEVSDLGNVRCWRARGSGKPMLEPRRHSLYISKKGYPQVSFKNASSLFVHRMVLEAFVGPRPAGMVTRHLDGVKTNNRLSNLVYGTPLENAADAIRLGELPRGDAHPNRLRPERLSRGPKHSLSCRGERQSRAKLSESDVLSIRSSTEPATLIAQRHGVQISTISNIRARRIWAWLDAGSPAQPLPPRKRSPLYKVTPSTASLLIWLKSEHGKTNAELADWFSLGKTTVARSVRGGR